MFESELFASVPRMATTEMHMQLLTFTCQVQKSTTACESIHVRSHAKQRILVRRSGFRACVPRWPKEQSITTHFPRKLGRVKST